VHEQVIARNRLKKSPSLHRAKRLHGIFCRLSRFGGLSLLILLADIHGKIVNSFLSKNKRLK
jgi:hypothetical protein